MKNGLSARQLAVASFTGLLSPAAAVAGLDWRGAVLAIPVVLAAAWCWSRLGDAPGGWTEGWHGWPGRLLSLLYIIGSLTLSGAVLATAGTRMTAAGARGAGWVSLLLGLCLLWMTRGKPAAFGRAAEIFYLAVGTTLVFVLVFGGLQVKGEWLLAGTGGLWRSFLTAAGVGCFGVFALLLWDGGQEEGQRWLPWSGGSAAILALMAAVTVGVISPTLAAAQARPFFVMTVGLGRTARVEGLVSALWLLADVTMAGLLLQSARRLWPMAGLPREKGAPWVLCALTLGCALLLQWAGAEGTLLGVILPPVGLVLGGVLPALACLWRSWRKGSQEGEHI